MSRRAALVVGAILLLAACGEQHGTQTLDGQRDLVGVATSSAANLTTGTRHELELLSRACPPLDATVGDEISDAWRTKRIDDRQCQWNFGFAGVPADVVSEVVVGIVEGDGYRLHETATLLDHERGVDGVGDEALYDPESRTLFATRRGRLWYVQLVGSWPARYSPQPVTTAIARALLQEAATR
ncbi:MAG TPA: hypothetical protein VH914_17730 [Acidimicrobiia bacterium]|jgi:hypothetical protein|nr:hypothetical protein [Acidimicrobiia bacterium]